MSDHQRFIGELWENSSDYNLSYPVEFLLLFYEYETHHFVTTNKRSSFLKRVLRWRHDWEVGWKPREQRINFKEMLVGDAGNKPTPSWPGRVYLASYHVYRGFRVIEERDNRKLKICWWWHLVIQSLLTSYLSACNRLTFYSILILSCILPPTRVVSFIPSPPPPRPRPSLRHTTLTS